MAAGLVWVLNAPPPPSPLATSVEAVDPYEQARQAYVRGDLATAIREWTPLAAKDTRAQLGLGDIYYNGGPGVPVDITLALAWYYKAGSAGNRWAELTLAKVLSENRGVRPDDATANYWYRNAAMHGLAEAAYMAGVMAEAGRGIRPDMVETAAWYDLAAELGHPDGAAARDRVIAGLSEQHRTMLRQRIADFRSDLQR